jgi:hypothetical protein
MYLWIYILPTQPIRAALGAESRVYYPGNTAEGKLNERSRTTVVHAYSATLGNPLLVAL